jgi:hypothetical protein
VKRPNQASVVDLMIIGKPERPAQFRVESRLSGKNLCRRQPLDPQSSRTLPSMARLELFVILTGQRKIERPRSPILDIDTGFLLKSLSETSVESETLPTELQERIVLVCLGERSKHPTGGMRRLAANVTTLNQQNTHPAEGRLPRNRTADQATTNDQQIILFHRGTSATVASAAGDELSS